MLAGGRFANKACRAVFEPARHSCWLLVCLGSNADLSLDKKILSGAAGPINSDAKGAIVTSKAQLLATQELYVRLMDYWYDVDTN